MGTVEISNLAPIILKWQHDMMYLRDSMYGGPCVVQRAILIFEFLKNVLAVSMLKQVFKDKIMRFHSDLRNSDV